MKAKLLKLAYLQEQTKKQPPSSWADPEGDSRGPYPPPPLKNHKNIGFPSNIDPCPLNITKLPSQHSMVGQ